MVFHLAADEANRLIRENFRAPHYDVSEAEDGLVMSFLVTGIVPRFQRHGLKKIVVLQQRHLTRAAFNELAARKKVELGRYVISLEKNS